MEHFDTHRKSGMGRLWNATMTNERPNIYFWLQDAALKELHRVLYEMGRKDLTIQQGMNFDDWIIELAAQNMEHEPDEWFEYDASEDPRWHAIILGIQERIEQSRSIRARHERS